MKNYFNQIPELKLRVPSAEGVTLEEGLRLLIIILIAMTPVFSIGEIMDLFLARVSSKASNSTPTFIKAIKDLGFVTLVSVSALMIIRRGRYGKLYFYSIILIFVVVVGCIFTTIFFSDAPKVKWVIVVGIRWLMPLLLVFFIADIVNEKLLNRMAVVLGRIFYIHLGLQFIQLFFMGGFYGMNSLGLAARVPGFFLIPSTASFFSVIVVLFQLYFGKEKSRTWFVLITGFSAIITQSGTGFVVYFMVIFLYYVPQKLLRISILSAPFFGVLMLLVFAGFASRGDVYLEQSGGTRIEIFNYVVTNTGLLSSNFGVGTNAARILKTGLLMDSMLASVVYNLGLLFSLYILIVLLHWLVLIFIRNDKMLYSVTAVYGLFGAAAIFFEAFPMNLIFGVLGAFLIKQEKFRLFN